MSELGIGMLAASGFTGAGLVELHRDAMVIWRRSVAHALAAGTRCEATEGAR